MIDLRVCHKHTKCKINPQVEPRNVGFDPAMQPFIYGSLDSALEKVARWSGKKSWADRKYLMSCLTGIFERDGADAFELIAKSQRCRGLRHRRIVDCMGYAEAISRPVPIDGEVRSKVWDRDGDYGCCYCKRKHEHGAELEIDHVKPIIQGGDNKITNLVLACKHCNHEKSGRTPQQWQVSRGVI